MASHTHIRAGTHTKWPHERFETAEVSFADWNHSYEHWLCLSYASTIKPFYNAPSATFVKYQSAYGCSLRQDMLRLLKTHLTSLNVFAEYNLQTILFEMWKAMSYEKRKELCLKIWENQVRRCEKRIYPFRRDECPELTLENVAGNTEFMEDLFHGQVLPPQGTDYRIVRNAQWESLNDPNFGKGAERLTNLSAGVRGFVEEGYIARHLYLAQFTTLWINSLLGKPLPNENNPTLASSYNPTEADVQALRELQVAGHPVVTNDMLDSSGVKYCTVCKATQSKKKLVCCQKCLTVKRNTWYCGADCQRKDWPTHNKICGKAVEEATTTATIPSSTRPPANALQAAHLDYLELHPRAIFGMSGSSEDHRGKVTELDFLFYLPTFVRPFFETHKVLVEVRDKAVRQRDDLSVGIVALFMLASAKYGKNVEKFDSWQVAGMLEPLMDMTQQEVEKAMAEAEAELATTVDKKLLMVASALQQMKSGIPDPAFPSQHFPSTPSALQAIDLYLSSPKSFFAAWPDPAKPDQLVSLNLPAPFRTPKILAAGRSLSLKAFETQDDLAVGAIQHFVRGCTRYRADSMGPYIIDLRLWARYGWMIGKSEEEMRELRDRAEVELPLRREEEWRFLWRTILEMREWVKKERANEAPPKPPPGDRWPRIAAEVFGDLVYGPDPLPSTSSPSAPTETVAAGAKKKNNRKKKKKSGGAKGQQGEAE